MRIGAKKRPFYRVVVVDERSKRNGAYIELLGTYNPLTKPHEIKLKQDRIDHWIKQGAQPSDGFLRITGKAKQRPPRKAKKQKQTADSLPSTAEKVEEKSAEAEQPAADTVAAPTESPAEEKQAEPSAEDSKKVEVGDEETDTTESVQDSKS